MRPLSSFIFRSDRRLPRVLGLIAALALGFATAATAQALTYVGAIADDVGQPTGVTLEKFNGTTYLYVSDHNGGRVFRYNLTTGTRTQIGFPGRAPGQFIWPDAIVIEPTTRDLYIADRQLHRITRITQQGTFVMKWGDSGTLTNRFGHPNAGTAPGQLNGPQGLALDAEGNLYVTEHENHRVQKFRISQSGGSWNVESLVIWGSGGSAPGEFNTPYGITLDRSGNVWVADGFNSRLKSFTPNGQRLTEILVRGSNEPHLVATWVAFDPEGDMYVSITSDPNTGGVLANQRIEKFSPNGTSIGRWGSYGSDPGQFKLPFGIAIDPATRRAYVADWDNRRVQIFDIGGTPPVQPPKPALLANISTRVQVTAGDASRGAIAGFVVTGTEAKPFLVRAVGPGLAAFGVSQPLANPQLRITDQAGRTLAENDDWGNSSEVAAASARNGAFALGTSSRDAALLVTLPPGVYSAQVSARNGSGVALVEVYDADPTPGATPPSSAPVPAAATKLINLSTRGLVATGEGQLAAGFVIEGDAPKRVLLRAIGPSLAALGVSGAIDDPTLAVYASTSAATPLAQNDNWETPVALNAAYPPASAIETSRAANTAGAFALTSGSRDAALVVTLAPGAYSAVVRGTVTTPTGAALVEVYELPEQ